MTYLLMNVCLVITIIMVFLMKNQEYVKTFKNFNDFYYDYKYIFDGYKNCIFRKIVKVGNTIIKKENIKIKIMVYDRPYIKEQQDWIIAKHNCDYWLKELNIEQFSNLCKDYGFTNINIE